MDVASKVDSDTATSNNAWFTHFFLGATSFPPPNNLKHIDSSISTPPIASTEDDDEFGDFESVPARPNNNSYNVTTMEPVSNGDKGFSFDFADFESSSLPSSNGGKQFSSQAQQVSGISFPFPVSHGSAAAPTAHNLLDPNSTVYSFSSNLQNLDQNNVLRADQTLDRNTVLRPKETLDQNNVVRPDQASTEIGIPVESNGEETRTETDFDEDWGDFVETPVTEFRQHHNSEVNGIGAFVKTGIGSTAVDEKPDAFIGFSNFGFDSGPSVKAYGNDNSDFLDLFGNVNDVESVGLDAGSGLPNQNTGNGVSVSAVMISTGNPADIVTADQKTAEPFDGRAGQQNPALENISKPLPLSLFGEEDSDSKVDSEDKSSLNLFDNHVGFELTFDGRRSSAGFPPVSQVMASTPGIQFNDFIANLYRQAEKDCSRLSNNIDKGSAIEYTREEVSSISFKQELPIVDGNCLVDLLNDTETTSDRAQLTTDIFYNNEDEDLDSSGWEFKDAFTESNSKSSAHQFGLNGECVFDCGNQAADSSEANDDKLRDVVAFYAKLRAESHSLTLAHLSFLEESLSVATEQNNVDEAATITKEIQAARDKFGNANDCPEQYKLEEHQFKNATVEEIFELLHHHSSLLPFESEFHLADLISSAKENVQAAVNLYRHTVSVLRILGSASIQEQSAYLTIWGTITSACAAELQHGLKVWSQASDANVQMDILVHPRGKGYFASLREVFRVSEILRASVKLYRPWILLNSNQAKSISVNLKNCTTAWVESGLKEVVLNALPTNDSGDHVYLTSWKSMDQMLETVELLKQMLLVDALSSAIGEKQPVCRLSLLPIQISDDLKAVDWCGQRYFLVLANLWANCVSCKPPQLPGIEFRY
eukprot:Gb_34045 [translate_table: standard]